MKPRARRKTGKKKRETIFPEKKKLSKGKQKKNPDSHREANEQKNSERKG